MDKRHARKDGIDRFPRLAEVVEGKEKEEVALAASVWTLMSQHKKVSAQHRKSRLALGRELLQLKGAVKHGQWEGYYEKRFGNSAVTLRSAQRYMRIAKAVKNDIGRFSKPGADRGGAIGQSIRKADQEAKADVGASRREEKVFLDQMFKQLTSELLNLPSWPDALQDILELFKTIRAKFNKVPEIVLGGEIASKEARLDTAAD